MCGEQEGVNVCVALRTLSARAASGLAVRGRGGETGIGASSANEDEHGDTENATGDFLWVFFHKKLGSNTNTSCEHTSEVLNLFKERRLHACVEPRLVRRPERAIGELGFDFRAA